MKIKYWTIGLVLVFISYVLYIPAFICDYLSKKYLEMNSWFCEKLDGWYA